MPYFDAHKIQEIGRLNDRIAQAIYEPVGELSVTAWQTKEPVAFHQRESGERIELKPGDKWGDLFDCAWFHFTGEIPDKAAGKPIDLLIDVNGEALVVDENGVPVIGLTCINSNFDFSLGKPGKRVVPFAECATAGAKIDIWADAGCNDLFGGLIDGGKLKEARIAVLHPDIRALFYDVEVLVELAQQLPDDCARRARIGAALFQAATLLDVVNDATARTARAVLAPELAKQGGDPSLTVSAIGHAHIDLAWLWPLRETIRKGARTFATVLRMMERYPDYHFGASQPQLFQWIKDNYPELYAQIKQRVAEGRFEVQGAMWVEADANVPSGESLARQLLYGKRFYREEFGIDVRGLWLPDVFGYSGALPQLLRLAGVDWFMTQKLSWNVVNRHPHHTFHWHGIDGSSVLAHMPPEDTYNSSAAPRAITKAERNYADKSVSDGCLLLFGIGDGGGGPGEEHLERLSRERNLSGIAPVVQEPSQKFFERLAKTDRRYARWHGELYLERHQGTFTTQARNKRNNRKLEFALREAEYTAARAMWELGEAYPQAELEAIWKEMLLLQFHDILPGSSITRVYTESVERYAALLEQVEQISKRMYARLNAIDGAANGDIVANTLPWERTSMVQAEGAWRRVTVPAMGSAMVEAGAEYTAPTIDGDVLENEYLRVTINPDGSLASVFDKQNNRESITPEAAANQLAVYVDEGDAWDFSMEYDRHPAAHFRLIKSDSAVQGPEAVVTQHYTFGESTLTQRVVLRAGSRRVEFETEVDWRENAKMLRTSFPIAVTATEATCEIQFGNIRRPLHRNTLWDLGKFEVCAHKWVDISERSFGVALLNDCKYGHKLRGNVIDLNLLRSPSYPDPQADRTTHQFTYALYPHTGDYAEGGVVREAFDLNVPVRISKGVKASGTFIGVDAPNVVIDTVKKAEDSDDLIVRMYEAHGASVNATLTLPVGSGGAERVNLLEESLGAMNVENGGVTFAVKPFEVVTVKVKR